jgi:hypothetical protein
MTVASEVMAILALTTDLRDMRERLGNFSLFFKIWKNVFLFLFDNFGNFSDFEELLNHTFLFLINFFTFGHLTVVTNRNCSKNPVFFGLLNF